MFLVVMSEIIPFLIRTFLRFLWNSEDLSEISTDLIRISIIGAQNSKSAPYFRNLINKTSPSKNSKANKTAYFQSGTPECARRTLSV